MKRKIRSLRAWVPVILVVTALLQGSSTAASAAEIDSGVAESRSVQFISHDCLAALQSASVKTGMSSQDAVHQCKRTATLKVGAVRKIAPAQLAAQSEAPPSLVSAAAAGIVYGRPFSQTIAQITDQETQNGYLYYDGSYSWVKSYYRGYRGSHSCWVNYAVGYSIEMTQCDDWGVRSSTNAAHMGMTVHLLGTAFPVSWHEDYYVYISRTGSYWQ